MGLPTARGSGFNGLYRIFSRLKKKKRIVLMETLAFLSFFFFFPSSPTSSLYEENK